MTRSKPPEEVLRALVALEGNPDFEVLAAWLNLRLMELDSANRAQPNELLLRWGQGRAQEVADFLDARKTARQALNQAAYRKGAA